MRNATARMRQPAKKSLIDAFRVVEDDELVGRYRRKMSSLLLV